MSRGCLMFAFNTAKYNYVNMAKFSAQKIAEHLSLPVSIVTNSESMAGDMGVFDKVIVVEADKTNARDWGMWINKGRFAAYELSPYDETLLLDTDYVVNSDKLLSLFDMTKDLMCHENVDFMMQPRSPQEVLSPYSFNILWATVVCFKKTKLAKQVFDCMEMIQKNFEHYANLHGFVSSTFRNDYALTIALRMVNGQFLSKENIIPFDLMHVSRDVYVERLGNDQYRMRRLARYRGKSMAEYIETDGIDFHMLDKDNFMEIIGE